MEHAFVDVLGEVTEQLSSAITALVAGGPVSRTADPVLKAIESLPGAGRLAVFQGLGDTGRADFLAGPSFSDEEVELLKAAVGQLDPDQQSVELEVNFSGSNDAVHRVRLFPLAVPGEVPRIFIVTARDDGHTTVPAVDKFIDIMAQVSGVVIEDRRLRSKVRDQQSILGGIIGAAPDAIIRIDRYGEILDFAGQAEHLFGYRSDEVLGENVSCLMPEPHALQHDQYVEAFIETGERRLPNFGRRLEARRKDGSLFPVEIALSQIPGSETAEFIGIVRDITRRVRQEVELNETREAYENASRQSILGELAASISHELNQPLTAIANYMDALELRLAGTEIDDKQVLVELARKAGAQARLGGEIVRRTRRMAITGDAERLEGDFHKAVAEAVKIISVSPDAQGVSIVHDVVGTDAKAEFDRVQLIQVIANLAANAFRAMKDSPVKILTLKSKVSGQVAELVVADTGPGVPTEDRSKVFNSFYRRSRDGMGMGLAIAQRIAKAHSGGIELLENDDAGATFRFRFPRAVDVGRSDPA